jgi:hypothetical protein
MNVMNVINNDLVLENIYPSINESSFINNISDRFEFNIPVMQEKNTCVSDSFKLSAYQIFLKNFISNETPYNSILIYHGTGTGKTCSAISIAENFRDVYHMKDRRIIILSSGNIKQGWYNNIYNQKKDAQCTGQTYKYLGKDLEDTKKKADKLVKKYYDFFGYLEFTNRIRDIYDDECKIIYNGKTINIPLYKLSPIDKSKEIDRGSDVEWKIDKVIYKGKVIERIKKSHKFKEICNSKYSNRVLIIDEAHNIRGNGNDESDDNLKYLRLLVENTRNLKLILLSATPMYNKANEIVDILSLLYANNDRDYSQLNSIFKNDELVDVETLTRSVGGYVSYIKGGGEDKFPKKIYPKDNIIELSKNLPLYECKMNNYQRDKYLWIYENINTDTKLTKDSILKQCSNIIYPNDSKDIKNYYGVDGLNKIINYNSTNNKYKYKKDAVRVFSEKNIERYSTKIKMLLEKIKNSEGIIFIYSQYIISGILPIMLALEENGYSNYSENIFDTNSKKNGLNYISLTANKTISKNNDKLIEICRSWENRNGEKIKIILGSNVATEGLDLKNIREIYIFDPWYHLKKLEQIIGRGIRYCSHTDLEEIQKDTTIYIFASTIIDKEKCIDLEIYDLAIKKNDEIIKVEKILQENAVDVELFKSINHPTKIKDKDKCKKTIKKNTNSLSKNQLENMYNVYKIYIKDIFKSVISCNIETIIEKICDMTETRFMNEDLLYLTLKNMVDKKDTIIYKSDRGYLINIDKNYIFQPLNKLDNYISIYDREKNTNNDNKYINLTIKKKIGNKIIDISEIDIANKLIDNIKNSNSLFNVLFNDITGFDDIIKYHILIERLNISEKRKLIEDMIDDKLDTDLKEIVFDHFKTNLIDKNFNTNIAKDIIGYILFDKNTQKKIKRDDKDKPIYIIKNNGKYDIAGKIQIDKITEKIKNDKINTQYYIYNYKDAQNKTVLKIIANEKNKMTTTMCSTQTETKTNFKSYFSTLYEQYIDIFNNYSDDKKVKSILKLKDYCMLIEILLRIETRNGKKYHYNYDEYMILSK